jgi:hypothetical protein
MIIRAQAPQHWTQGSLAPGSPWRQIDSRTEDNFFSHHGARRAPRASRWLAIPLGVGQELANSTSMTDKSPDTRE